MGFGLNFDLDGLAQKLEVLPEMLLEEQGNALRAEGQRILQEGRAETPVDVSDHPRRRPGALRDSGHVTDPLVHDQTISVTVVVGDKEVWYARFVHNREAKHTVGQAHFLTEAGQAAEPRVTEALSRAAAAAVEKAGLKSG